MCMVWGGHRMTHNPPIPPKKQKNKTKQKKLWHTLLRCTQLYSNVKQGGAQWTHPLPCFFRSWWRALVITKFGFLGVNLMITESKRKQNGVFKFAQISVALSPSANHLTPLTSLELSLWLWLFDLNIYTPYDFRGLADLSRNHFSPIASLVLLPRCAWSSGMAGMSHTQRQQPPRRPHTLQFKVSWQVDYRTLRYRDTRHVPTFSNTIHKYLYGIWLRTMFLVVSQNSQGTFAIHNLHRKMQGNWSNTSDDKYLTLGSFVGSLLHPRHTTLEAGQETGQRSVCVPNESRRLMESHLQSEMSCTTMTLKKNGLQQKMFKSISEHFS